MKKTIHILAMFALSFALFSCKAKTIDTTGKIKLVSSIFPQYDWAQNIAGPTNDKIIPKLIVKNGVDVHSFQPSANDIVNICSADILIYTGGESESWIKDALKNATNKNMIVINLSECAKDFLKEEQIVEGMQEEEHEHEIASASPRNDGGASPRNDGGDLPRNDGGASHDDDEVALHNYDEVDLHDDDEHDEHHHHDDEIEFDEHIWFSIDVVKVAVNEITNALCTLDSENKEVYEQRKQTYISKLNLLDTKYKNALSSASKDTIIVCDRFPFAYLTDAYDINYYAAFLGCSAETEASFETITFLANKIDELDTNNVIILESSKDKLAKTIIHSTKNHKLADIHVLDSMQSTTLAQIMNGKTYIGVMEENLETLKKVLN